MKLSVWLIFLTLTVSLLSLGAWIEINAAGLSTPNTVASLLSLGAWIEILTIRVRGTLALSLLSLGAWIEIWALLC